MIQPSNIKGMYMGKLPKQMQERKDRLKSLRTQGSTGPSTPSVGGKGMNRQMRRRLQQQGVDGMEQIEARRVIIQTDEKNLVIESPQVIKLKQQGMEIYQIVGSAQESVGKEGEFETEIKNHSELNLKQDITDIESETLNVQITDQDIQLVVLQTGVSREVAETALQQANGDLARAIITLKSKQ